MQAKNRTGIRRLGNMVAYLLLLINTFFIGMLLVAAYSPYINPVTHKLLACMGLTFPIFLFINACFFVFWLVVRYKFALLPLIGFLLCFQQIRTYLPINIPTREVPEESIKFLSFNTMAFGYMEKKNGKNQVLTYLQESQADIICLQEYATSETAKIHLNEKDIKTGLSDYPYHHIQALGSEGKSGNKVACYSKFPILSARLLPYESNDNGSVMYELLVNKDTVTVINNHLESNKLSLEDRKTYQNMLENPETDQVRSESGMLLRKLGDAMAIRAKQARAIAKAVAESPHPYVIVCGDFNDSPISYAHRVISEELDDAFVKSGRGLGISFNQNRFYFRIDNILVSKNLKTYNCTVDRSVKSSDHYPIWCYITKR